MTEEKSTIQTKLKAMGPGILMASAAVGGSHIVSSTQAGAIYGWQLAIIVLLVNLFKYPFFRYGAQYALENNKSLVQGYEEKGKIYLWLFFIMNIFSAFVNTAAVGILTAAILYNIFPNGFGLSIAQLSAVIIIGILIMILIGGYKFMDSLSKAVMISLTLATVLAVIIAMFKTQHIDPNFIEPSPWKLSALTFIISLMGWMPAPIEISAINSMWSIEKRKVEKVSIVDGIFDFNVGYIGTAILAFIFLALGALIQYGSREKIEVAGAAYIKQFIGMYASAFGDWSRLLIAFIAFLCLFGTTITVIDGYSRVNNEALRLILKRKEDSKNHLNIWIILTSIIGILIIFYLNGNVAKLMYFAMIASFLSAPIYSYLNFSLVNGKDRHIKGFLYFISILGLIYLTGFSLFFLAYILKLI